MATQSPSPPPHRAIQNPSRGAILVLVVLFLLGAFAILSSSSVQFQQQLQPMMETVFIDSSTSEEDTSQQTLQQEDAPVVTKQQTRNKTPPNSKNKAMPGGGEDADSSETTLEKKQQVVLKVSRFPECSSSRRAQHPGVLDGPRVQYIHVPKAGGTSIQDATVEWVHRASGATLYKFDGNSVRYSSVKCPVPAFDATVLTGHRGFGFCENIEHHPRGLFTFTSLRGAVSRMISWFDYNLYDLKEERSVAVFGKLGLSLGDIVKQYNATTQEQEWGEKLLRYAGQQQARFLCGYECMGPMALGNKNYTEQYILDRALVNLRKLDVLGITEEMDRMIVQLRFHLPQLVPKTFTAFKRDNKNDKKRSPPLDAEAMEIMSRWGWVDVELLKEAKKIYAEKQALAEKCMKLFGEWTDEDVATSEQPST